MHNNKIPIVFFLLIILIISFSGCTDLFNSNDGTVTYPNILTQISYDISYGIKINCTGSGVFNIKYSCDDPEVLSGYATDVIALNDEFELLTNQASFNYLYDWNISKTDLCSDYELGLEASIISNSFNVEDLNGEDALTIDEIKNNHPDKITNYCNRQANDTTVFIDPFDEDIRSKAIEIYENSDTNNSFLIAKELFIWLKSYTSYK